MNAEIARREDEKYFNTVDEVEQEMPRCAFCGDTYMRLYKFCSDKLDEEVTACYFCIYDRLKDMKLDQLAELLLSRQGWLPSEEISYLEDTFVSLIDDNFDYIFEEN